MYQFASFVFLLGFLFLISIITGFLPLGEPPMLVGQVIQNNAASETGASNFVTSVVLGYRGIDTLGELSILFAAATAGSLVLSGLKQKSIESGDAGFLVKSASELFFPLLIVVGLYIVLHGHLTPGGGFQGGVILAAAFFLPLLAKPSKSINSLALGLIEGLSGAAFIIIGLIALFNEGAFLKPFFKNGELGSLISSGTLPLLYIAVGLKVGAELASLLNLLNQEEVNDS